MPWQGSIRVWLHGLPDTPPEGVLEELLRLMVPPDSKKLRELVFKSMVAGYNIGGEHTTRGIGKEWRRAVKRATGTASVREAEEPFTGRIAKGRYKPGRWGGATLAEYLDTGREWNQERRAGGWNLRDERILEATRRAATRVTGEVTQSMLDDARDVLGSAFYRRGLGPAEVAEELDGIFPPTYGMRHEAIARTEMAGAYSDAQDAAFANAGIMREQWLAFLDARTRSDHRALHGQITKVGEPWVTPSGDSVPGPGKGPARQAIRCRCDKLAVFDEETELPAQPWLGEDVEEYKKERGSEKLATISAARPADAKAGELAEPGEEGRLALVPAVLLGLGTEGDVPPAYAIPEPDNPLEEARIPNVFTASDGTKTFLLRDYKALRSDGIPWQEALATIRLQYERLLAAEPEA